MRAAPQAIQKAQAPLAGPPERLIRIRIQGRQTRIRNRYGLALEGIRVFSTQAAAAYGLPQPGMSRDPIDLDA